MQPLNKTKLVYFSLNKRNKKSRLDFTEKHQKEAAQFWGTKILGADETKNYMTASLQGGSFMAASGTGSTLFIDDVITVRNSRMNSEVCRAVCSAQIQAVAAKLIRQQSHLNPIEQLFRY